MRLLTRWILFCLFLLHSGLSLPADAINVVLLPEPFGCHHLGIETGINQKNTLGILGTLDCDSDRPTYGSSNDDVSNRFSRILVPWRYSRDGAFNNSFFMQALIGLEKSQFRSNLNSSVDVTFVDLGFHLGYQWFWQNGLNISVLGGIAYLVKTNLEKDISQTESSAVREFLNKNSKTNFHGVGGLLLGWKF